MEDSKEDLSKMKESTMAFALRQCAENRARIAREAKGDYGTPIHIVCDDSKSTYLLKNGKLVKGES